VHSNEQIRAAWLSGGRSLSQHSQPGRSSSMIGLSQADFAVFPGYNSIASGRWSAQGGNGQTNASPTGEQPGTPGRGNPCSTVWIRPNR
jgi:hypothetical protein